MKSEPIQNGLFIFAQSKFFQVCIRDQVFDNFEMQDYGQILLAVTMNWPYTT